jgi:hypothetical protein
MILTQPRVIATGIAALAANPLFLKDQCYWPESIGADEEFEGKLVVQNQGDAGQVWLGLRYAGKDYLFIMDGQETIPLDKNQTLIATYKGTIRDFLKDIEEFKESKTIELTFLTGYFAADKYTLTDSWAVRTYVKVGAAFPIPIWMLAVVGVVVVGGGLWLVTRKK